MAATTSAASGSVRGRNRATTVPSGPTRNFSKFHWMSPAVALGVGQRGQLGVDRVPVRAVDLDLLEHRERDAVGGRAELGDLLGAARLLPAELVAGEADDGEAAVSEPLLQPLQAVVLRRQAALGGDVDDQQRLAGQVVQRSRLAVQGGERNVVQAQRSGSFAIGVSGMAHEEANTARPPGMPAGPGRAPGSARPVHRLEQRRRPRGGARGPAPGAEQPQDHDADAEPEHQPPHAVLRAGERRPAAGQGRSHDRSGDRDAQGGAGLPAGGGQRGGHPGHRARASRRPPSW